MRVRLRTENCRHGRKEYLEFTRQDVVSPLSFWRTAGAVHCKACEKKPIQAGLVLCRWWKKAASSCEWTEVKLSRGFEAELQVRTTYVYTKIAVRLLCNNMNQGSR